MLRKSGYVDIYWNFTRTYTTDGKHRSIKSNFCIVTFTDINSNYLSLFLKSSLNETLKIDLKWESRVGLEVAETFEFD